MTHGQPNITLWTIVYSDYGDWSSPLAESLGNHLAGAYIYIYSINGIQIQPHSLIVEGSLMISDPNPQNRGNKPKVEILRSVS
jgi:hypothetical protein